MKYLLMLISILSISLTACNKKKVGEITIEAIVPDNAIEIDRFPLPLRGVTGFNTLSYPSGFSFEKIDEAVYSLITNAKFNANLVTLKIRNQYKDSYGKDSLGDWINLGDIDKSEALKYADFATWNRKNALFKMISNYSIELSRVQDSIENRKASSLNPSDLSGLNAEEPKIIGQNVINLQDFKRPDLIDEQTTFDTIGVSGKIISYLNGSQYDVIVIKQDDGTILDVNLHAPTFRDKRLNSDNITGKLLEGYGYHAYFKNHPLKTFLIKAKVILD